MSFTRCVVLVAVGCGLAAMGAMGARGGDDKPSARDDAIKAFVAHFAKNGVKLEAGERGEWVVADPKADGYQVIVHFRTFPASATEREMNDTLKMINLAHMLNAPSRLAMSHPGLRATDPAKPLPKLDQVPVAAKLEKLFKEYRPPEPTK
jgi:hypothetical protein